MSKYANVLNFKDCPKTKNVSYYLNLKDIKFYVDSSCFLIENIGNISDKTVW